MPLIDKIEGDHSTMAEEVSVMAKTQRGKAAVDIMARREHSIVTLPAAIVDKEQIEENINLLRRFHLGDPRAAKTTQLIGDDLLPALLDVYRGRPGIRYDYPLFLRSPESESEAPLAEPLSDFLSRSIETFAPGQDSARMLKDNLPRLERYIDKKLKDSSEPCDARPLIAEATVAVQKEIDLVGPNRETLQKDLDRLLESVEAGGQLMGYGPYVAIHLLNLAVHNHTYRQRKQFVQQVKERQRGLNELLAVEKQKTELSTEPDKVQSKVGSASRYFDSKALSGALSHKTQGSVTMDSARLARIQKTLALLESYDAEAESIRFLVEEKSPWLAAGLNIDALVSKQPCADARQLYEDESERLGKIFAAFRIAKLEIEGKYEPDVHDSWFDNFDWEAFSAQELLLIPTIVVLVSSGHIASEELPPLSRLLSSRKPIQVLCWVQAHSDPGTAAGEDPLLNIRTELAYVGLGQRQANVVQSSASRHDHLLEGFCSSLGNSRASLYLVSTETDTGDSAPLGAWMMASSAMESRAHPFFQVIRGIESEAEDELSITGNNQPEIDWSINQFSCQNEQGQAIEMELAFTFADYCLLTESMRNHFRMVLPGGDAEDLISVSEYLDSEVEKPERAIPYILAVDGSGLLQKVVISRALIMACRDRKNYWRSLQAQCGIHNKYVEQARQEVREEERAIASQEREQLVNQYETELERVKQEATRDVMGKLANVLVGLDAAALTAPGGTAPAQAKAAPAPSEQAPAEAESPAAEAKVAEEPEADDDEVSFNEPWIDSILCTTCDDCMSINKVMFVYNDDKQAHIPDPSKGTYADLVKAAEACPARCIHPGKPLNPDEPGLEDLIQRAEAYN